MIFLHPQRSKWYFSFNTYSIPISVTFYFIFDINQKKMFNLYKTFRNSPGIPTVRSNIPCTVWGGQSPPGEMVQDSKRISKAIVVVCFSCSFFPLFYYKINCRKQNQFFVYLQPNGSHACFSLHTRRFSDRAKEQRTNRNSQKIHHKCCKPWF